LIACFTYAVLQNAARRTYSQEPSIVTHASVTPAAAAIQQLHQQKQVLRVGEPVVGMRGVTCVELPYWDMRRMLAHA
jgi:hypothetical protein